MIKTKHGSQKIGTRMLCQGPPWALFHYIPPPYHCTSSCFGAVCSPRPAREQQKLEHREVYNSCLVFIRHPTHSAPLRARPRQIRDCGPSIESTFKGAHSRRMLVAVVCTEGAPQERKHCLLTPIPCCALGAEQTRECFSGLWSGGGWFPSNMLRRLGRPHDVTVL